jgi:hypothetical protein
MGWVRWLHDKSRFRQIELSGDGLHLFSRQLSGTKNDSQRITAQFPMREHIECMVLEFHVEQPSFESLLLSRI